MRGRLARFLRPPIQQQHLITRRFISKLKLLHATRKNATLTQYSENRLDHAAELSIPKAPCERKSACVQRKRHGEAFGEILNSDANRQVSRGLKGRLVCGSDSTEAHSHRQSLGNIVNGHRCYEKDYSLPMLHAVL